MPSISKSVAWSGIETFGVRGVSFVVSMVIARLVAPEAYGLIAMINVFVSFFEIFVNGGFKSALIQKRNRKEIDFHTVFISNFIMAIILYCLMYFGAPLIAEFYKQQEMIILVRFISITLILQSLTLVQSTRLTILYNFKAQAIVSLSALVVGATFGISLAYQGYGVWALVGQTLSSQFVTSIGLMFISKWTPKFEFSTSSFRELFSFGSKDLVTNIFTSFYININNLIIGKFYSPASLAFYNRGFSTGFMPASLWSATFNRITYPVLCEFQHDRKNLLTRYYQFISIGNFVLYPIMFIIVLYSKPIISLLLTDSWLPTVPYLQIMCFVFISYPMNVTMGQVVNALGFPEKNLRALYLKRGVSFLTLIITVPFGVKWIAIGVLVATILEVLIASYVAAKVLKISILSQYKSILKLFLSCIIMCLMGTLAYLISKTNIVQLLLGVPICIFTYITFAYILNIPEKRYITQYYRKLVQNLSRRKETHQL